MQKTAGENAELCEEIEEQVEERWCKNLRNNWRRCRGRQERIQRTPGEDAEDYNLATGRTCRSESSVAPSGNFHRRLGMMHEKLR
jgi:hypothetical protein